MVLLVSLDGPWEVLRLWSPDIEEAFLVGSIGRSVEGVGREKSQK